MRIDIPLRLMCAQNDLTKAEIARRLGVTPQAFNQKLKRGTLSLSDIENIASVSGCKLKCCFVLNNGQEINII